MDLLEIGEKAKFKMKLKNLILIINFKFFLKMDSFNIESRNRYL